VNKINTAECVISQLASGYPEESDGYILTDKYKEPVQQINQAPRTVPRCRHL